MTNLLIVYLGFDNGVIHHGFQEIFNIILSARLNSWLISCRKHTSVLAGLYFDGYEHIHSAIDALPVYSNRLRRTRWNIVIKDHIEFLSWSLRSQYPHIHPMQK